MPWTMQNKNEKTGEIRIYGLVTNFKLFEEDTSPTSFQKDLDALGEVERLNVYINSPGGGIFSGNTIYDILKRHPAFVSTYVDGMAASIAAVILQAGDERIVAKNGMVFIHNPIGGAYGFAEDLMKVAEDLRKIKEPITDSFAGRVNISRKKLQELMDNETLMTASEALEMGFVDRIEEYSIKSKVENKKVTYDNVTFDYSIFKNFDASKIMSFEPAPDPPKASPQDPVPAQPPVSGPPPGPVDYFEQERMLYNSQNRITTVLINNLSQGAKV